MEKMALKDVRVKVQKVLDSGVPVNVSRGQESCVGATRKEFLDVVIEVLKLMGYPAYTHFVEDPNDPKRKYGRLYLCPKNTKKDENVYDLPKALELFEAIK